MLVNSKEPYTRCPKDHNNIRVLHSGYEAQDNEDRILTCYIACAIYHVPHTRYYILYTSIYIHCYILSHVFTYHYLLLDTVCIYIYTKSCIVYTIYHIAHTLPGAQRDSSLPRVAWTLRIRPPRRALRTMPLPRSRAVFRSIVEWAYTLE